MVEKKISEFYGNDTVFTNELQHFCEYLWIYMVKWLEIRSFVADFTSSFYGAINLQKKQQQIVDV